MKKHGIMAFAFGLPPKIGPNCLIADMSQSLSLRLDAPIYTQRDVPLDDQDEKRSVSFIAEPDDGPPSTLAIARGGVQWALQKGVTDLHLVAAPPHLPRAYRDVRYVIQAALSKIDVHLAVGLQDQAAEAQLSWFCPDSDQWRTRNRLIWSAREAILIHLPFCLYERVAS